MNPEATSMEAIEPQPEAPPEAPQPKLTDVQKQRKHVDGKRTSMTKRVKRGIRRRMNAVENVFVTLIGELRGALYSIQQKHEEHDAVLGILCKQAMGKELGVYDLAVLAEIEERTSLKELPATPDAEPTPPAE